MPRKLTIRLEKDNKSETVIAEPKVDYVAAANKLANKLVLTYIGVTLATAALTIAGAVLTSALESNKK